MTPLWKKMIKIDAKVVRHIRLIIFQLAEVVISMESLPSSEEYESSRCLRSDSSNGSRMRIAYSSDEGDTADFGRVPVDMDETNS